MEYTADESVSKEVVARWKHDLNARGYAVRSINSMLASLNSLLIFLGWEDCKVKNIRHDPNLYYDFRCRTSSEYGAVGSGGVEEPDRKE